MRRLVILAALAVAGAAVPTGAAASPTVRLAIVHALHGCHVWAATDGKELGPARTVTVARGTRLQIRITCPMSFDVVQTLGPRLALGGMRWEPGTTHTLVFLRRGVFRLEARNVQSSEEMGLQTLGPDNAPALTIRVR